jgi:hypothetical protein
MLHCKCQISCSGKLQGDRKFPHLYQTIPAITELHILIPKGLGWAQAYNDHSANLKCSLMPATDHSQTVEISHVF